MTKFVDQIGKFVNNGGWYFINIKVCPIVETIKKSCSMKTARE